MNISNESNTFKESQETAEARTTLMIMLVRGFRRIGRASKSPSRLQILKILQEVPATFEEVARRYKADIGVLLTTKDYARQYLFFIEIDGKTGHGTTITKQKEDIRDSIFLTTLGALTIRIPLKHITDITDAATSRDYFDGIILNLFAQMYTDIGDLNHPTPARTRIIRELNTRVAAGLADNQGTHCLNCSHLNNSHDLGGCEYQFAIDPKKHCDCTTPFLRSEK